MRFTTIAWRNLLRRPTRTLLTVVGLAIAVAAVVALVGISDGFERSYVNLLHDRQVELIVQRASGGNNLNRLLDPSLRKSLQGLAEVNEVFPSQMDVTSFPDYDLSAVITIGWEPGSRLMNRLAITSGRTLRPGDHAKAIIGAVLAANMNKKPGEKLTMYGEEIEIVGVFDSHSVFENGSVFMPIGELQRLMSTRLVTAFSVSVNRPDDPAEVSDVARRIERMDPTLAALPVADFVDNIQQIRLARGVAWAVSAIALVIGAIGMLNTMVMSVAERVREIGTLRAIGWTKRRVMSIILCESILLSIGAAALGTLTAIGLTKFLSGFRLTSGVIAGQIAPAVILQGLLVAILIGISGAAYPAFWGASQRPTDAMRRK
ncbi:MAG TPA: ABC transporter permease [Pirellulales bacterium]|jgi:putative ABC transport system permease protein|nr:ABC transporter permease [Pirellulales bacterium]